jgi:sugar phosphate isomerase/epimerase
MPTSRRDFLTLSAAALSASFAPSILRRTFGAPGASAGHIPLGVQSYTLRDFPVDKAIQTAKDVGFEHVEFFGSHFPTNSSDEKIEAMKSKMARMGMRISAHGVNGFGKDHQANRRLFEFARKAGIKNLSADPSEDSFDSLDKLVAEFDIRIAIHNHGPGARYDKIADVLKAIKGHDPRIGACADLGHYIRSGEDPVKAITLLEGRLYGIHLKDFAEPKSDAKGVILGKGHLDVVGVYRALKKVNFPIDGALSLEYEENAANPVPDVTECVAIAREAEAKALS